MKKTENKMPNFIRLEHETARTKLHQFPAFGILPFKAKDLNRDEMDQILYELESYPQYHLRISTLFETEKSFRKEELQDK